MPRLLRPISALFLLLSSLTAAIAGTPPPADEVFRLKATKTDAGLTLVWTIAPGNYLYRAMLSAKNAAAPAAPIAIRTPTAEKKDDPNFGSQEIYRNSLKAEIASADIEKLQEIVVTYQGCAEKYQICYPPIRRTINQQTLDVTDRVAANAPSAGSGSAFEDLPPDVSGGTEKLASPSDAPPEDGLSYWETLGGMLASFFGFGALLSLSPCTLPMVPIFFGLMARSNERASLGYGLGLAAVFVGASASAYSLLGAFAGWSGSGENLQLLLQTPIALGMMSAVLIVLSLSMFGLFEIQLPAAFVARMSGAASAGRHGPLAAAAVLGFTSALIAGPCVTPPLATALLYVARTGNIARGMAELFLFGVGLGIPLLVFGALGPRFLPKPGPWLVRVRHAFGFILIGVAISILSRVLSQQTTLQLWGGLAVGAAAYLGTQFLTSRSSWRFVSMGVATVALLAGSVLLLGSAGDDSANATRILENFVSLKSEGDGLIRTVRSVAALDGELAAARAARKPVLVDFSADWCVECTAMDAVLRKPEVRQRLQDFWIVRADVTAVDASSRALMKRFEIVGPPSILLFGKQGGRDPESKIVGAVDADALLSRLSTVGTSD